MPSMGKGYMPPSQTDDWATPKDFYDSVNLHYGFELDAAASSTNHLAPNWFGLDHPDESRRDGLTGLWAGRTWCNPPYGRGIKDWVAKASQHNDLVVMLLPARTDTRWYHDYIYNHIKVDNIFIKGRLKFGNAKTAAPFPSMLAIFHV